MHYDKHEGAAGRLYLRTVPNITQPTRLDHAKSSVNGKKDVDRYWTGRTGGFLHIRTFNGSHAVLADTSTTDDPKYPKKNFV